MAVWVPFGDVGWDAASQVTMCKSVSTISKSMKYMMVDIDEDADTPSGSINKFCSKICARIFLNFTDQNLCIILYRNIWWIYVNLCKLIWMYIPLGRKYHFMLSRCRTMTSYIENDVRSCMWISGQVVMSCSSYHSLVHVPQVTSSNPQLEKSFFFQDHLQT